MNLPKRLEDAIDVGGLIIALIVDIVMNVICFFILAPDLITSIAFVAIGVMTVLFVFRSWSKRQYGAWIIFVAVVFFFDYSFTLEATRAQSETAVALDDAELSRLQSKVDEADAQIIDLQRQYDEAAKRETMDQIYLQIEAARTRSDRYEAERRDRLKEVEGRVTITADAIFRAIPNAWNDGRFIQLAVFGLIFIGLQLIVASSIDAKVKGAVTAMPEPVPAPIPAPATIPEPPAPRVDLSHITQFVTLSWYRVDQKTSEHILPKESFFDYMKKRNNVYDDTVYDYLLKVCILLHIVSDDGVVLVTSKHEAILKLERELIKQGGVKQ